MLEAWQQVILGIVAVVGSVVAVARVSVSIVGRVVDKVMAQSAAREIAAREANERAWNQIAGTQREIVTELKNHMSADVQVLGEIREHMGEQTEALRGVRDMLLVRPSSRRRKSK